MNCSDCEAPLWKVAITPTDAEGDYLLGSCRAEAGRGGWTVKKINKNRSGEERLREETSNDVDGSRSEKTPQRWRVRAEELIGDKNPLAT